MIFSPLIVPVVKIGQLSLFPADENSGYFENPEKEVELGLMVDQDMGNTHGITQVGQTGERISDGSNLVLEPPVTRVPQVVMHTIRS